MKKLFPILVLIAIIVLITTRSFSLSWRESDLSLISSLILLVTVYFIYRQALSTEELIDITSRPKVSVGIASLMGSLDDTRIIINNFSNFTAFVWTKLNLKIDDKDANEHLENKYYVTKKNVWEIDPSDTIHPIIIKQSILKHKGKKITIDISVYYSSDRKPPKNSEWIKLNSYSFRSEERQWLKDRLGIEYSWIRANKNKFGY